MKTKSIFYIYIIFILNFFSILPEIKGIEIIPINGTNIQGILEQSHSFKAIKEVAYFSYQISDQDKFNLLLTINSTKIRALTINCIFSSTSDDETIVNDLNDKDKDICTTFYGHETTPILKMYDVIPSFESYMPGSNLFLKINSSKTADITIFVRKEGSFLNKLEAKNYTNAFAHYVFEFIPNKYLKDFFLLTSSESNSIFIFGEKNMEINDIDTTSAFVINEQSLSAHFWEYDKIYIFIGKKEYISGNNNYDIKINKISYNDESTKLYYYIPNINYGFISFYYHCSDETTNHYFIVNYGNLDTKSKYYYKFHNLIGSKSSLVADLPLGNENIQNLEYSEVKRFNNLDITDSHLQVLKFQCSGNGNKMNINIKYSKKVESRNNDYCNKEMTKDFLYEFNKQNSTFSILYNALLSNEFALEIFTPDNEDIIVFNATFEGHPYIINNKNIFFFNITDKAQETLSIKQEKNISAIISFSPTYRKPNDILIFNYDMIDGVLYYYIGINHEFNSNYTVDFEVKYNGSDVASLFSLCYYLTNTAVIEDGQNCILVPTKNNYHIKMENIFKHEQNIENFNEEEPKYYLVVYSKYNFTFNVNITTDLQKSKSIDQKYNGQKFLYLKADLEENKDSYFNIKMTSKTKERYLDLYILSETNEYENELKFEIKCIMKYELAINFIEQYFTEENNRCYIINKFDFNSNVYHIIFNATKNDTFDDFIIKISSKENIKVKFVFNENAVIEKFPINSTIKTFDEQSVYKIIELDKSSISSINYTNILFYDRDINGIELYGRKNNNFTQIFKGSLFIIDSKELLHKSNDYDTLLLVYGKNDCGEYCKNSSSYQIKFLEYFSYVSIKEFNDYYRIPITIKNCIEREPYYILFDYGKEYKKESISISKIVFYGKLNNVYYIDQFTDANFERNTLYFRNYNKTKENSLHLYVIRFTCENKLFAYFDFFTKIDYSNKIINLEQGSIKHYIIQNNTKFTFNYKSINEIKINLLLNDNEDNSLTIHFENREFILNRNRTSINLIREINNTNIFNLTAPFIKDIPILITALINLDELPPTEIKNLYQYDDKIIYDIQPNTTNITFIITRHNPGSRLLLQEEEGSKNEIKICYNVAKIVLLEKNEGNCFYIKDRYELVYKVPEGGDNDYLVFYPIENDEKFDIIKITTDNEGDNENGNKKGGKENNGDGDGGLSGFVIFIIVFLVLINLIICVLLIIKYTKKTVTSEDIEKNNKAPSLAIN